MEEISCDLSCRKPIKTRSQTRFGRILRIPFGKFWYICVVLNIVLIYFVIASVLGGGSDQLCVKEYVAICPPKVCCLLSGLLALSSKQMHVWTLAEK